MDKMRLSLEQLRVESFDTMTVRTGRGTVHGAEVELAALDRTRTNKELDCAPISSICPVSLLGTCDDTCQRSCPNTCDAACTPLCSIGCTETLSDCRFTGEPVCCV